MPSSTLKRVHMWCSVYLRLMNVRKCLSRRILLTAEVIRKVGCTREIHRAVCWISRPSRNCRRRAARRKSHATWPLGTRPYRTSRLRLSPGLYHLWIRKASTRIRRTWPKTRIPTVCRYAATATNLKKIRGTRTRRTKWWFNTRTVTINIYFHTRHSFFDETFCFSFLTTFLFFKEKTVHISWKYLGFPLHSTG